MAARSLSRNIIVRESWWGLSYIGYREDLIAKGHLREEWIRPKPYKNAKLTTMLPDGREVIIYKRGGKLEVVFRLSETEREARRAKEMVLLAAQRAQKEAEDEIAKWSASKQDFKRRLDRFAVTSFTMIVELAKGGSGGYRLAPESVGELAQAMMQVGEVLKTVRIEFHPEERAREEARVRAKAASHDPAFAAFLERAMTPPADSGGVSA